MEFRAQGNRSAARRAWERPHASNKNTVVSWGLGAGA